MAKREWAYACPALSECDTVKATDADDAIAQVWDSGFFGKKLDEYIGGAEVEHAFGGYIAVYVFPIEGKKAAPVRFDLRLTFVRA